MSQGGIQPGSVKTLALDKSKAFVGVQKKSRFQKASRDMQQPLSHSHSIGKERRMRVCVSHGVGPKGRMIAPLMRC